MMQFRDLPLKQKLIFAGLLTTAAAMLLAGCLMFILEFTASRRTMVRDLTIKTEIIGNQCAAALLFNVRQDTEETLSSLRADPDIEYAAVYSSDEQDVFARYLRPGTDDRPHLREMQEGHRFTFDHLTVVSPIRLKNRHIGSVLIQTNLKKLNAIVLRYALSAGLVLGITLLVAYALVSRLQKIITQPVMDLVRLMQHVSQKREFSLRAAETGKDELTILAKGFNEMLTAIEDRDHGGPGGH